MSIPRSRFVINAIIIFILIVLYHLIQTSIRETSELDLLNNSSNEKSDQSNTPHGSFVCDYNKPFFEFIWGKKNEQHPAKHLRQYCSKIPNPISGWRKSKRYRENDVAFVIYTGAPFYKTRARAVRETWVSRVTNYYFLSSLPDASLPITVVQNTGEDYQSNTKKIFYGLESIYKNQQKLPASQRHKWYFLGGCDTYVHVPYFLKRLEQYDYKKPYFIGGSFAMNKCFYKNGTSYESLFVGGNTAHVFSAALVEAMYPHLSTYVETVWPRPNHTHASCSDVALSCLIFSLGYNMTIVSGFWRHTPDKIIEEFGLQEALAVKEPSSWHYIQPAEMMDLDEFYAYQYVDRLVHGRHWKELIDFNHLFITSHYALLRKIYKERSETKT